MIVGSGKVICWGRRSRYNVCSGPIFGVDTVSQYDDNAKITDIEAVIDVVALKIRAREATVGKSGMHTHTQGCARVLMHPRQ